MPIWRPRWSTPHPSAYRQLSLRKTPSISETLDWALGIGRAGWLRCCPGSSLSTPSISCSKQRLYCSGAAGSGAITSPSTHLYPPATCTRGRISVAESLDAVHSVSQVGLHDREFLRLGLRTALVKSHHDFATFDALFARFLVLLVGANGVGHRTSRAAGATLPSTQRHEPMGIWRGPPSSHRSSLPRLQWRRSTLTRRKHPLQSTIV